MEELISTQCGYLFNCNCDYPPAYYYEDASECRQFELERYRADRDVAVAAGLSFDEDCVGGQLEWTDELGCGLLTDELLDEATCTLWCAPYHGEGQPGEACSWIVPGFAHDCAQGLDCGGSGFCEDPCGRWLLAEGQVCWNDTVEVVGVCREGLYCDTQETFSCTKIPATGEPCPAGVCNEGDWCNLYEIGEPVCTRVGSVGATCEYDNACDTGYCIDGRCAPLPTAGEPCSLECAGDLYCYSGTCALPQAKGQSCGSLPCASGLSCDNGVCVDAIPYVCGG